MNKYKITYGGISQYINLNTYDHSYGHIHKKGQIIHVTNDSSITGKKIGEIYINDSNLNNINPINKYKLIETTLTPDQYSQLIYRLKFEGDYWKVKYNYEINNYQPPDGIVNIGNTCFANSVFQFLYAMPEYILYLNQINIESQIKDARISPLFAFFKEKYKDGGIIYPYWVEQLYNLLSDTTGTKYVLNEQKDAGEFINNIIKILHLSCNYKQIYNPNIMTLCDSIKSEHKLITKISPNDIVLIGEEGRNIFKFDIHRDITFDGETIPYSTNSQPAYILNVPMVDKIHGYQFNKLIESFTESKSSPEPIDDCEGFSFELNKKVRKNCSQKEYIKTNDARYLIMSLNRFTVDLTTDTHITIKLLGNPKYNLEIDLDDKKWELVSVIVHNGETASSGHYICYTKTHWLTEQQWYCLNDKIRELIDILNDDQLNIEITKLGTPYLFLYKLKNHSQNILKIKKSMFQ